MMIISIIIILIAFLQKMVSFSSSLLSKRSTGTEATENKQLEFEVDPVGRNYTTMLATY